MKRIIILLVLLSAVPFMNSCNEKYKKEILRLQATSDSLIAVSQEKDEFTMQYVRSYNTIQSNLDSIKAMEKIISEQSAGSEVSKSLETDINRDIDAIYQLLLKNKQLVDRLKTQLNTSGRKSKELEQMINALSEQIASKDAEITQLKIDLSQKNLRILDLEANLEEMEALSLQRAREIEAKIDELNTVYYIIGTKDALLEQGIIVKDGGFLGLGRTQKIADNFDISLFTKADLRQLDALPVFSKKVQLISVHPLESYDFIKGEAKQIDSLSILRSDDFWSATNKLVLLID